MPADIYENNVYSLGKEMWHGLGTVGTVGESAMSVYGRMTPVSFEQRPFGIMLNGSVQDTGKHYGIVRIDDVKGEVVVGQTKGRYVLTQPAEYVQTFDTFVGKNVETMGFLCQQGQRMFITSELPAIDVHGDKVEMYSMLAIGFDGIFGEKLFQTAVRTVCQNTWTQAIADSQNRFGGATYAGKHNQKDHLKDLGIWMAYVNKQAEESVKIYEGLYRKMEEKPVTLQEAGNLFAKVYSKKDNLGAFHPDELRGKNQGTIDEYNKKQDESIDVAMQLFCGAGIEITKTVYGIFNCITEQENRHRPSKKAIAESILIGNRANTMQRALNIVKEYVGE